MALSLHQFCEWLAATPVSNTIQDVTWIIPLTQTVHIVCIALLIGSAAMLDFRVFGIAARGDSVAGTAKRMLPWIWGTLPIFLITGTILTIAEPSRELENATFVKKMIMLACAIVVTALLQSTLRRDAMDGDMSPGQTRGPAKLLALLSLALFVGIVFAGRLIAYTPHP